MEKMINNVKRKKRKTRRCLDEIRKRAYSINCRSESNENKNNVKSSGLRINSSNLSTNSITIQRLTLFPKAIRSETVTRPVLLENNSHERFAKNIPLNKITLDQNPNEIPKLIDINSVYVKKDFNSEVKSNNNYKKESERKDEIYLSNESSPNSFVLFSPIKDHEKSQNDPSSSLSIISSPGSHADYSYLLYEEFIDEVPVYLKHNAPSILNEDVIEDNKVYLRNLFMEDSSHSSQDESNVYFSDNTVNSSPEAILQNPKDYLRQRLYERNIMYEQDVIKESDSFSPTNKIPFSRQSPCSPEGPVHGQTQSIIQITPEYNYYPHKLN